MKRIRDFVSKHKAWSAIGALLLLILGWMAYLRFVRGFDWGDGTGFSGKTLWDWLELLIVPIFIAVGAWWLDRRQKKTEREFEQARLDKDREIARQRREQDLKIAEEKRQDTTLEAYFDRMTALLLEEGLRDSKGGDEVRKIARTRTLAVLRRLEGGRKGQVVKFLQEAKLIQVDSPIVNLQDADLRGIRLHRASLRGSDLGRTNMRGACLHEVDLKNSNLQFADLQESDLQESVLDEANLQFTNLQRADMRRTVAFDTYLFKANLFQADLRDADLPGAVLQMANLREIDLRKTRLAEFGTDEKLILSGTDLQESDLQEADLREVYFNGADLQGADLRGADLCMAYDLDKANFKGVKMQGTKVLARDVDALKRAGANIDGVMLMELDED